MFGRLSVRSGSTRGLLFLVTYLAASIFLHILVLV